MVHPCFSCKISSVFLRLSRTELMFLIYAFSGKLICTGSDDATLRIWDPKSAQSIHVVRGEAFGFWLLISSFVMHSIIR